MKPKLKEHQELSDALISFISPDGAVQMFNVKNNAVGRLFVRMVRKALNRSRYDLRVRGSLSDRVSLRKAGTFVCDQSVPLKIADRLRVYIQDKQDNPNIRYWIDKCQARSGAIGMLENTIAELRKDNNDAFHTIENLNASYNNLEAQYRRLKAREPQKTFEIETEESVTVTIQINKK